MRKTPLKVLHTSDWHLGHSLYGVKRDDEFSAFLDWMVKTIDDNQVDVLLISGDIFPVFRAFLSRKIRFQ